MRFNTLAIAASIYLGLVFSAPTPCDDDLQAIIMENSIPYTITCVCDCRGHYSRRRTASSCKEAGGRMSQSQRAVGE